MSTKCLICYCDNCSLDIKIEIDTTDNLTSKTSVISKHLDVIFILRNIFEVPVSQLAEHLKNCPKVNQWICICDKCQDIVTGYRRIYDDLLEISRKFEEAKLGIIKIVKKSYNDDNDGKGDDLVPGDITDECRRFINNHEYQNPDNPFKDGDLKALGLIRSIHQSNWQWTSTNDLDDTSGPGPDSREPADVDIEEDDHDHWSGGHDEDNDDLVEPVPEEQLENKTAIPKRGRGRPPGTRKQKRVKISMESQLTPRKSGRGRPPGSTEACKPVIKPKKETEPQDNPTARGRGRPSGKQKRLDELMEEWKPGFKPKKWKPKKRKYLQRPLIYPCPHAPECPLQFSNRTILDSHLKRDHGLIKRIGAPKKYPLEYYDERGRQKSRFRKKIPSKCESCNKWFKSQDSLRTHIKFTHENRFPYYCKICGIGRHSKSMLEKHEALCSKKQDVHPLAETESCPEEGCTIIVSRATGLEVHFREKHPEREPFSGCPHCEQKLYTKLGYARHLKSEHQISKPFKCEHCGLEFKKQYNLDTHKKIALRCKLLYQSETEATIICEVCGGKYSSQASLEKHIKSQHEDKFKLRCEHCDKGFGVEEVLNVHLFKRHQIGDGSNLKYKCKVDGCSRICFQKKQFECHMAMHEGKTPGFTCEDCGKQFYDRHGLRQHKKLKHGNELKLEKFKCEKCGAEFGVIDYLKRHKRTVHKIFPEKRRQDL